ncbi:RNA 2',3'-cyclic phosphodiesterase [Chloroflexota bacterium]
MEPVRAFIAIELPAELKESLRQLETGLKSGARLPVKWVDPGSMHLTLKFLGNVNADRLGDIVGVMEKAAAGIPPFILEVGGLGAFPDLQRVQVVWVGVGGDTECLNRLQQSIESGLAPLGFAAEPRKFAPHLTLARVRDRASYEERQDFGRLIERNSFSGAVINVNSVNLMRSQLTGVGPIYTQIGSVNLK